MQQKWLILTKKYFRSPGWNKNKLRTKRFQLAYNWRVFNLKYEVGGGGVGVDCLWNEGTYIRGGQKPDVSFCLLEDGPIIGGGGGGGAFHWKLTLYEDNQETNTHFNSQQTQVYFIERKCLNKCILKYKYTTAGHVNPKKPSLAKMGTVYPRPVLWCSLWGFKACYI